MNCETEDSYSKHEDSFSKHEDSYSKHEDRFSNEEDNLYSHEDRIKRLLNAAIDSGDHEGVLRWGEELFNVSIAPDRLTTRRHRDRQLRYFPPGWSFGSLPANWFRTLAGGLLFQARNELGLSQKEFSQLVETAPATLSRIENGLQDPSLGTLLKIFYRCGFRLEADLVAIDSDYGPKAT